MDIGKIPNTSVKQNTFDSQKNIIPNKTSSKANIFKESFNKDTISISDEARNFLIEDEVLGIDEEYPDVFKEILERFENASDSKKDSLDNFIKCIIIAARIINGDKVPTKDILFLAETEPKMYSNAMLLRRENTDPKKYDSLLGDEKEDFLNINKINDILAESTTNNDIQTLLNLDPEE